LRIFIFITTFLALAGCGEKAKPSPVKVGLQPNVPAAPEAPPKPVSRADIEASIKLFTQHLGERYRSDAKWVERFKAGEPESINEILRPVLKENHLTQEEYEWAIDQTEELAKMQEKLISDAILGSLDPDKESLGAKKPE
jgi:hypothetical protein